MTKLAIPILTREDIVDMFSSFSSPFRKNILEELDKAIDATEADATNGAILDECIAQSLEKLLLMKTCCEQAQEEFEGLSKRTA